MRRRRPQLLRHHQQRPARSASTPRWPRRSRRPAGSGCSPSPAPSASRCSPRRPAATSASRPSGPPATGSTSPATTSCSTGSTTTRPTPSASTSSRWATRASSPGSPGTSRSSSRSSSSSPGSPGSASRPGTASARPRPAPRSSPRCSSRPASSGSRTSTSSSTSPSSSSTSRCRTGDRVAIVGNSAALGSLTADACSSWGLEVTHGPVCLRSEATAEEFRAALTRAFADDDVDSVLTCFIPPLVTEDEDVAAAVREAAAAADKPCVSTFLGMRGRRRRALVGARHRRRDAGPSPSTRCRRTPCGRWRRPPATASGGPATTAPRSRPPASTAGSPRTSSRRCSR